ncbi:MAG TPA: hypothetical protein VGO17_15370 [Aurantimonas sp.]|jgi:hypothetical protein|nr:hypothetical protein [Aurantimonas sp.]
MDAVLHLSLPVLLFALSLAALAVVTEGGRRRPRPVPIGIRRTKPGREG